MKLPEPLSIFAGSISLIGMRIGGVLAQIITLFFLARIMSLEMFGFWSLLQSIMVIFSLLDLGTTGALQNRLLSNIHYNREEKSPSIFLSVSYLGVISALFVTSLIFIIPHSTLEIRELGSIQTKMMVAYVVFTQGVKLALQSAKAGYFSYRQIYLYTLFELLFFLLSTAYVILFYYTSLPINLFFYGFFSFSLVTSCLSFALFLKKRRWKIQWIPLKEQILEIKQIASSIGGLSLISLFSILLFSIDLIKVSFLLDLKQTAEFALLQKLYSGILLLTLPITTASWSSFRLAYDKNNQEWIRKTIIKVVSIILIIILCLGSFITLFHPQIIEWWSGNKLQNDPLAICFWIYTCLLSLNSVFATYLLAIDKYKMQLIVNALMVPLNLFLSVLFARQGGSLGILIATNIIIFLLIGTNVCQFFHNLGGKTVSNRL